MNEFEQIRTKTEREKAKKKNVRAIKKTLDEIDPSIAKLNSHLVEEAGFYAAILEEINQIIERDGIVDTYQNGENQWGTKKSVAAELKPKYTATYQSLVKQLTDLLPEQTEQDAMKEILGFIQEGNR